MLKYPSLPINNKLPAGKFKYFIAALSAAIIWGFFAFPLRNLRHYPSAQILQFRIFFSLVITWLLIVAFRYKALKADFKTLRSDPERNKTILLIVTASVLITGNWYTFIYAINNVSLKSAAFAYMICPLITALAGFLILKESATRTKLAGIALAI